MPPIKTLLILSESPAGLNSGGSVIARERAVLLAGMSDLNVVYVDWNSQGAVTLDLPQPLICQPISIASLLQRHTLGFRLRRRLHRWLGSLMHRGPWFFGIFARDVVAMQMQEYLATCNPDLVCFDNIASTIAWDACDGRKRVYFAHNVEADIVAYTFAQGWLRKLEQQRMCTHEARILREADQVISFTQRDAEAFQRIAPGQAYRIIPPAFATPLAAPDTYLNAATERYAIIPSNAAWQPNVLSLKWFVDQVLPLVSPQVKFVLTGRDQNGWLAGLAKSHANLRYAGLLDRPSYEALFRNAALFVNPTCYGSGFQIKLMEALRYGIPVISTAFSNHLGERLAASDKPENMARMIDAWMLRGEGIPVLDYACLHEEVSADLANVLAGFAEQGMVESNEPRHSSRPLSVPAFPFTEGAL